MWKLYDWQCTACGFVREAMVNPPDGTDAPRFIEIECARCDATTEFLRLTSPPAKYLGDRPMRPTVYGGRYDTTGYRTPPAYPELRDGVRYERREVAPGEYVNTKVVQAGALIEHQNTAQWNEVHAAREAMLAEDAPRRERVRHLKAGTADLRQTKLPGDPLLGERRKANHGRWQNEQQ
mgnify:CR=1 FL=1